MKLNTPGVYEAKVMEPAGSWFGESAKKGTPYIALPLTVVGGDHHSETITWYGWLSSDAACDSTTTQLAKAFGFNGDFPMLNEGKYTLAGQSCSIVVEVDDYKDAGGVRVKWLNPIGMTAKPVANLGKLLERVGKRSKAIAKAALSGQDASVNAPEQKAGSNSDDVPF